MGVLLKIKVISRSDTTQHLTDTQVRMLQTSIKRKILSIVDYITVSIGATFQQENNYLVIVVIKSDPGHDTKLTVEPLIKYLDTDKRLEVNVGKRALSATLTSKIALSKQNEATNALIYTARDMEQPMSRFELLYADDAIMKALGGYQPLSKLLYCKQLQLNDTEYFRRSGPVVTNTSAPLFPIFDYYMITPTQIRVCVDSYLQSGKGNNKRSGGHKAQGIPYSLMMQSLLLTMVIWTTIT